MAVRAAIMNIFMVYGVYEEKGCKSCNETYILLAERQGFEPWEQLPVHRISSAARSTTPASFLGLVVQR